MDPKELHVRTLVQKPNSCRHFENLYNLGLSESLLRTNSDVKRYSVEVSASAVQSPVCRCVLQVDRHSVWSDRYDPGVRRVLRILCDPG